MYIEITDRPDCRNTLTAFVKPDGYRVLSASLEAFNNKVIVTVELAKDTQYAGANNEASQNTSGQFVSRPPSDPRAWC